MKFMKLGKQQDTFYTEEAVRCVTTEVSSDFIIQVKSSRYLLHKSPLLSKCSRLQRMCSESTDSEHIIHLQNFPAGVEAFEICAKFCYGMTLTVSALNIVSVRCAAEYLEMTEYAEKGNLIHKLEIFLNSCILHGWKDSIVTLKSTESFPLWSEDLGITSRCVDTIASKVLMHPSKVNWSYNCSRDDILCNGTKSQKHKPIQRAWWAEDIAELGIDLYWRIMVAIKSSGKLSTRLIGEALQVYASRWLPNMSNDSENKQIPDSCSDPVGLITSKQRMVLESIVTLLPMKKGSVSWSFLLKLLKAAIIVSACSSSKMELARRVGIQLEEATVGDLLIPSLSYTNETLYDVDIVMTILEQFMVQRQSPPTSPPRAKAGLERRRSCSAEYVDFEFQEGRRSCSASHSSKLKVAKIIDGYLQEIARDANLPLQKMVALAEAIPDYARPDHDDIYRVIDIYLKSHPDLNKSERKRLCRLLDCKKLSVETCMHAAQNELLPLRVVVQVLFFEQARVTMAAGQVKDQPSNISALLATREDETSKDGQLSAIKSSKPKITLRMKLAEDDSDVDDQVLNQDGSEKPSKIRSTRPKRVLSKLLSMNRSCLAAIWMM
ncbi:BTB/POZ domain-containing protein At1g67900-like [Tasmannia lanceolata]|uniref:BTB/POZ domain-containing protein At1g67900-like n=1 Tax=Tasmannia lanceolata TaxID=3420 RepID=UPI00406360F1